MNKKSEYIAINNCSIFSNIDQKNRDDYKIGDVAFLTKWQIEKYVNGEGYFVDKVNQDLPDTNAFNRKMYKENKDLKSKNDNLNSENKMLIQENRVLKEKIELLYAELDNFKEPEESKESEV